jgi:p-hydroxybenzoate 3-monooxygenase
MQHRVQVAIIGAGPSGLLLGALLDQAGIDHVLIELAVALEYVASRIFVRARWKQGTGRCVGPTWSVRGDCIEKAWQHHGFDLLLQGQRHRIDLHELTEGKQVVVYGQNRSHQGLDAASRSERL